MAIRGKNGKRVDVLEAERRLDTWLWIECKKYNFSIPEENFASENIREILKSCVGSAFIDGRIAIEARQRLLPIEYLDWIKNDKRQIIWLYHYIQKYFPEKIPSAPAGLLERNYIIASIDFQTTSLKMKEITVGSMRFLWDEHIKSDSIFKWFKGGEERARCECAWEWLNDKTPNRVQGVSVTDSYQALLIFFDERGGDDNQKKLDVIDIKKRWSQRKYRAENKEKVQCNFWISNQSIADLDKLAKKYGVKRPQIIEALIRCETLEGKYLTEIMRKSLTNKLI